MYFMQKGQIKQTVQCFDMAVIAGNCSEDGCKAVL